MDKRIIEDTKTTDLLIFCICTFDPVDQTRPLMAWPKLKGSIGVVVESFHDGGCKAPGWDVLVQRMCAVI